MRNKQAYPVILGNDKTIGTHNSAGAADSYITH